MNSLRCLLVFRLHLAKVRANDICFRIRTTRGTACTKDGNFGRLDLDFIVTTGAHTMIEALTSSGLLCFDCLFLFESESCPPYDCAEPG